MTTCIIDHMETAKQQYSGRAAQFKVKAAQVQRRRLLTLQRTFT